MKNQTQIVMGVLQNIYLVLLKRIAKGYSAGELSSLIGRDPDYVAAVEMLDVSPYSSDELQIIGLALEESNFKSFYSQDHQSELVRVQMKKREFETKIVYTCDLITDEGYRVPFFNLEEDIEEGPEIKTFGNRQMASPGCCRCDD